MRVSKPKLSEELAWREGEGELTWPLCSCMWESQSHPLPAASSRRTDPATHLDKTGEHQVSKVLGQESWWAEQNSHHPGPDPGLCWSCPTLTFTPTMNCWSK